MNPSILVIDDDREVAEYIASALGGAGYDVECAFTGADGQEILEGGPFDLVLLDLTLPDIDGFQVLSDLQSNPRTANIAIVLLTTQARVDYVVQGLDGGADDYITKPFDIDELVARVGSVLRRVRSMRDLSPLTGLPGNFRIAEELQRRVTGGGSVAVVHGDLDNFKAFNDHYGFMRGDKVIRFTASTLVEAARRTADTNCFIGHVGGDDFIMVMDPAFVEQFCKEVGERFDDGILDFYDPADALRGYVEVIDRRGERHAFPIVSFSMGVATNERRSFVSEWEASAVASEMKEHAKTMPGSTFMVDRRTA
jgi:DNA-binding response OmpR family regulator